MESSCSTEAQFYMNLNHQRKKNYLEKLVIESVREVQTIWDNEPTGQVGQKIKDIKRKTFVIIRKDINKRLNTHFTSKYTRPQ